MKENIGNVKEKKCCGCGACAQICPQKCITLEENESEEATDKEVEEKIKEMATMYGKKEEELRENEQFISYVKDTLKTEATIKFIVDNAKIK